VGTTGTTSFFSANGTERSVRELNHCCWKSVMKSAYS
jgi:hypothetical protein